MPEPTREDLIVDAFWEYEVPLGYEAAIEKTCTQFEITREALEKLLTEDDALNSGNF